MEKICKSLLKVLKEKHSANVLILIADSDEELKKLDIDLKNRKFGDLHERQETMQREIAAVFEKCQVEVIAFLQKVKQRLPITWEPMFLTSVRMNVIVVNGADLKLIEDLASMDSIVDIEENGISTIC